MDKEPRFKTGDRVVFKVGKFSEKWVCGVVSHLESNAGGWNIYKVDMNLPEITDRKWSNFYESDLRMFFDVREFFKALEPLASAVGHGDIVAQFRAEEAYKSKVIMLFDAEIKNRNNGRFPDDRWELQAATASVFYHILKESLPEENDQLNTIRLLLWKCRYLGMDQLKFYNDMVNKRRMMFEVIEMFGPWLKMMKDTDFALTPINELPFHKGDRVMFLCGENDEEVKEGVIVDYIKPASVCDNRDHPHNQFVLIKDEIGQKYRRWMSELKPVEVISVEVEA